MDYKGQPAGNPPPPPPPGYSQPPPQYGMYYIHFFVHFVEFYLELRSVLKKLRIKNWIAANVKKSIL